MNDLYGEMSVEGVHWMEGDWSSVSSATEESLGGVTQGEVISIHREVSGAESSCARLCVSKQAEATRNSVPAGKGTESICMRGLKPVSLLENRANVGFSCWRKEAKKSCRWIFSEVTVYIKCPAYYALTCILPEFKCWRPNPQDLRLCLEIFF